MKYKLLFLILILTQICFSQEDIKFRLDSEAIFPNGFGALYQKIKENLVYPQSALMQGKQGKVFIEFTIGADGYIIESSVKSIETFDEDCARSAEATLKSIKTKWTPAKLNGFPTIQKLVIPVVFSLEDIDLTSEPQSNEPLSGDLQITDGVFEIKAIIVPKIGKPKKIDWPIYKDMNMNEQIGSVLPGDSVKIIATSARSAR